MPTRLDYLVISSAPFTLQADQRRTLTFSLPPDLLIGPSLLRPLLAYKVSALSPYGDSADAELRITVNEQALVPMRIAGMAWRGLWAALPGCWLKAGVINSVQFWPLHCAIRVADVIIWFRRQE